MALLYIKQKLVRTRTAPSCKNEEDWCRVEDKNIQQNLNILRKAAINLIKLFKSDTQSKKAISKIMLDCLLEPRHILRILDH